MDKFGILKRFLRDRQTGRLRFLKGSLGFLKSAIYYALNRRISSIDYRVEYDEIASTYFRWEGRMARHTDNILKLGYLGEGPLEILDLACGHGYITRNLLERLDKQVKITAVDISSGMLSFCRKRIKDHRVRFVESEGLKFLRHSKPCSYDAIFFGWAMAYLDHRSLIFLLGKVLKPQGVAFVIANARNDLSDMEEMLVQLIVEHPGEIARVVDIGFNLPDGKKELSSWFEAKGFVTLEAGEGEEEVGFDDPWELYRWLSDTGAIAGIMRMFKDEKRMERLIVNRIAETRRVGEHYSISHRFAWGIFRKEG